MAIAVHISGHQELPGMQTPFTENVSARGARVLSVRRWKRDDRYLSNRFLAIFAPRPASLIASACATTALPSASSSWNQWAIGFSARCLLREITCTDKEDESEETGANNFRD